MAVQAEETTMVEAIPSSHPRILLTDQRVDDLQEMLKTDDDLQRIVSHLEILGDYICTQPPVERVLVGTKRFRLLSTSRLVLSRALTLGTLYRLDGQAKWRERLTLELKAVCAFEDWYPKHFLDTAEMSAAVAIGYDWLYNDLANEDRTTIRDGLYRLGLTPGRKDGWWVDGHNNWNQVCHCGLVLAALALASDHPNASEAILQRAKVHYKSGMAAYDPGGIYPEGQSYWNYGTSFSVLMASAVESVLGDDWGIVDMPGFVKSFDYRIHVQGPTGKAVNYADGSDRCGSSPYHLYLAKRTGTPGYTTFALESMEPDLQRIALKPTTKRLDQRVSRQLALAVAWYVPETAASALPLDWSGVGESPVHVAFMRGAWGSPDAVFASLKGGRLKVSHGHLDSGSFIVEADGVRWASDMGSDKEIYDRNDSWSTDQDSHRWTFFRANNFGHNTLTIDGRIQQVAGSSPIIANGSGESPFAVMDLSDAYAGQATSVKRGVMMPERKVVLVQDEICGVPAGKSIRWNSMIQVDAALSDDRRAATLKYKDKTMRVRLASPADARFTLMSAAPPKDNENPNEGWQRLVIDTASTGKDMLIQVLYVPGTADEPEWLDAELSQWK
jgi:hypothetical protein